MCGGSGAESPDDAGEQVDVAKRSPETHRQETPGGYALIHRSKAIADIGLDSNDLAETDDNSDNGATTHREERP
ncbi:hypothetical protein CH262_19105 [Rhodococcus sp. 05-2255-1e]|nr:hypothetical protein CH262_19105 [Rhodococcus sp. 05-2255-1e]